MLRYLGLFDEAAAIEHAVFVTLEAGVLTGDVVGYDRGVATTRYTDAIIANLGKRTERWTIRDVKPRSQLPQLDPAPDYVRATTRAVVGLDVFVESPLSAAELGASLMELTHDTRLSLKMISSRGTKVFPPTGAMTETGRPLPLPVHHPREPGRPARRRRARAARTDLPAPPLDAHREAAGVRRRARLHPRPGRELSPPTARWSRSADQAAARSASRLRTAPSRPSLPRSSRPGRRRGRPSSSPRSLAAPGSRQQRQRPAAR